MSTQNPENSQFTWIDFYKELADKLLKFKNNRRRLLEKLNVLDKKWTKFLRDKETGQWKFDDIDPFSVFAIFNRGIKNETRFLIAQRLKEIFQLKSKVPTDLWGIPVAFNMNSIFFDKENVNTAITPLWNLFESAINYSDDGSFISSFDTVFSQKQIGMGMITMALYWIRPELFIPLDKNTQAYLESQGIQVMKKKKNDLSGKSYLDLIERVQKSPLFSEWKHFPAISREAWRIKHPQINEDKGEDRGIEENLESDPFIKSVCEILRMKKNVILQGAPGTGKTYSTAAIALGILGVEDVNFKDPADIMEKYNEALLSRRIFFTTFHQSMDYEDFVEGLRPEIITDEDEKAIGVTYRINKGIFRKVCEAANKATNTLIADVENSDANNLLHGINSNPTIWKINLGRLCGDSIHADCLSNNYICLPSSGITKDTSEPRSFLKYLQYKMKVGDVILSSVSSHEIDAIGIVTGKFENHDNNSDFPYYREVRWIVKGICENIVSLNRGKTIARPWFHRFPNMSIRNIIDIINKHSQREETVNSKNIDEKAAVVLIIDEINRGNVSKIFGELVTLLEADKRDDGKQESGKHTISVILPYSKERFSVPSNVYIIGTMNTTDRSTGTLDYAIRRRFAFVTLPADPKVIQDDKAREIFNDIKKFIEDEKNHPEDMDINDLMVGHSYFMPDEGVSLSTEEQLKLKIKYEVAPLLREYCTDGLLTCPQKELDKRIESWEKLEITYKKDSSAESAAAASGSETSQTNE